jgi:hypothetical protein
LSGSLTIIERQTHCSCFIKKAICWKNDARWNQYYHFWGITPYSPKSFENELAKFSILCMAISNTQVKLTHLDITTAMVNLISIIEAL